MTPQEQLNADAQKYALENKLGNEGYVLASGFKDGALSPTAANGCNKHVEIAKKKAQIEYLVQLNSRINAVLDEELAKLKREWAILEQQLETLKQQQ